MRWLTGERPAQSRQMNVAWNNPADASNDSLRLALDYLRAKCDEWAPRWIAATGRERNKATMYLRKYQDRLMIVWAEYQSRRYTAQKDR